MSQKLRAVVALCALVACCTAAAATTTFKIATIAPDGTYWMNRMRAAADEVSSRTQGRVAFKFYPGGVMGNDEAVLRKIRAGQLHGGMLTGGGLAGVYPDAQIYSLPLLFNSYAEVDYVRARMDPLILEGLEKHGFVGFGIGDGGFALVFATDPVRSVSDLRGRKVWIPPNDPISRAMFESAGLSPVVLPLSDVVTGLQSGLVDTVGISPVGAVALQWYTKLKYVTDTPLLYLCGIAVVDKRTFSRMSPADQATVREIMGKAMRDMDAKNRADDRGARDALRHEGLQFVAISPQGLTEWKEVARRAREELARSGAYSDVMFKTLQDHLKEFRASPRVAH